MPRYCALLAEACQRVGRVTSGLAALTEAQAFIQQHGERACAAELLRLQGELLLTRDGRRHTRKDARRSWEEAEACYQQALDTACSQRAKMLELRAAMSLSRLWQRQGKRHEARQLLAGVYAWFTEGFETVDLKEARTLLAELEA